MPTGAGVEPAAGYEHGVPLVCPCGISSRHVLPLLSLLETVAYSAAPADIPVPVMVKAPPLVDVDAGLIAVFLMINGDEVAPTTTVAGAFVAVGNGVGEAGGDEGPGVGPPGFDGMCGVLEPPPPPPPHPAKAKATPKTKSIRFIFLSMSREV